MLHLNDPVGQTEYSKIGVSEMPMNPVRLPKEGSSPPPERLLIAEIDSRRTRSATPHSKSSQKDRRAQLLNTNLHALARASDYRAAAPDFVELAKRLFPAAAKRGWLP
jgi:hypothetical protein